MRTTVDLSDEILRRAKAEAALRGRKLKDLIEEGLRRLLDEREQRESSSLHDAMRDCCGIAEPTPPDYASNPSHLEGFGR
ncbi:MAG: hypothetical protein QMD73_01355 [Rhodocyclaceae bacterium]|nr:hypothetical protein [Rhodocyclaceae bacterium]